MAKIFRVLAAVLVLTSPARAQMQPTSCEQIRQRLSNERLTAHMTVTATNLLNATATFEKVLHLTLTFDVPPTCTVTYTTEIMLGRRVTLTSGRNDFAAVFSGERHPKVTFSYDPSLGYYFDENTRIASHHAVHAALMGTLGFETFESAGGSYSTILDLTMSSLPVTGPTVARSPELLLGVGSIGQSLYQVVVTKVTLSFL